MGEGCQLVDSVKKLLPNSLDVPYLSVEYECKFYLQIPTNYPLKISGAISFDKPLLIYQFP